MTRHFAVLGLPESVLPNPETVRDAFHSAGTALHPDRSAVDASAFQELNEAYAVVRDQARRLAHLLEISGHSTAAAARPGGHLTHLFFEIGNALQEADRIIAEYQGADMPLQKALLLDQLLQQEDTLHARLPALAECEQQITRSLLDLDAAWPTLSADQWQALAAAAAESAYLGKWRREIRDRLTTISEAASGAIL